MLGALTGLGLSAAAGLNAFIPLVILGSLDRFTSLVDLAPGFEWLATWPAILVTLAFLTFELVVDKIPGADTVNDLYQTPFRPVIGGLVFAAGASADLVHAGPFGRGADFWGDHLWLAWTFGILVGAATHFSKAASRTAIAAASEGTASPLASFAEDAVCVTLSVSAILLPWSVPIFVAAIGIATYRIVTIGRRRRETKTARQSRWRAEREEREEEASLLSGITGWLIDPAKWLLVRTGLKRDDGDEVAPTPKQKARRSGRAS